MILVDRKLKRIYIDSLELYEELNNIGKMILDEAIIGAEDNDRIYNKTIYSFIEAFDNKEIKDYIEKDSKEVDFVIEFIIDLDYEVFLVDFNNHWYYDNVETADIDFLLANKGMYNEKES